MKDKVSIAVQSSIGRERLDTMGAAIGAARMNPDEGYGAVPMLLKEYINNASEDAWQEIRRRIDNVYLAVGTALGALDDEEPFSGEILQLLEGGKKLFFKPNLVDLPVIHPKTHGPVMVGTATPWEFVAAVMRWFHDKRGVSYHQMAVGEAGTASSRVAVASSMVFKDVNVCPETVIEGKCGSHYVGWGFYFARKYLSECHDPAHADDPMSGYEESLAGACLPPGEARDRLMAYDLNRISDDLSNGRDVPVADGVNFKNITLHKAIVGGNPDDPEDVRMWPGCVLVNLGKMKIHTRFFSTCAVKNLGIGFYPMEVNASREPGKYRWKYAVPNLKVPIVKMGVPHSRWRVQIDEETCAPVRGDDGEYICTETGGLEGSIADSVKAAIGQGIRMLHVTDAIEATNISHAGPGCVTVPEGYVFASNDMVAMDVCVARYLFTTAPLAETEGIRKEYNLTSDMVQKIPMPELDGGNIVTGEGYDSAFTRFGAIKYYEERGLGQREYYVVGSDLWQGGKLASLRQRLGRVDNGTFTELQTTTMYHAVNNILWDLQAMCLKYLEIDDKLTGSNYKQTILNAYDENGDGVIDYSETGRSDNPIMMAYVLGLMTQDLDPFEALRLRFLIATTQLKFLKKEWNPDGHNLGENTILVQSLVKAFNLSQSGQEHPDPFFSGRQYGKGKWPSMQYAVQRQISGRIYGQQFPRQFDVLSPYGVALSYADGKWNGGKYGIAKGNGDMIAAYHAAVSRGDELLPFTFYVPRGFGTAEDSVIPNVEETDDPNLIFTASFNGKEAWKDLRISSFNLR